MASTSKKNTPRNDWLLILIFLFAMPPVGILLLVRQLLDNGGTRPSSTAKKSTRTGARTTTQGAVRTGVQSDVLHSLDQKGRRLAKMGAILAGFFAFVFCLTLPEALYWLLHGELMWFMEDILEVLPLLCISGAGLGAALAGRRKRRRVRRMRNYLAILGSRQSVPIHELASAAGRSADKVRGDVEDMIEMGILPAAFLDYGRDTLFLSSQAAQTVQTPKPDVKGEDAILNEIRQVNDAIHNEKMSVQIDRIGTITAKILEYERSYPDKAPQLHSFLSYYLPTTLKILRAYAQLEAQGVSGENITAAMQRIEAMMDKVVEGFEKQLDLLFQGEAMDVTADVEVLERMLAKDGLSGQQGMTLGL